MGWSHWKQGLDGHQDPSPFVVSSPLCVWACGVHSLSPTSLPKKQPAEAWGRGPDRARGEATSVMLIALSEQHLDGGPSWAPRGPHASPGSAPAVGGLVCAANPVAPGGTTQRAGKRKVSRERGKGISERRKGPWQEKNRRPPHERTREDAHLFAWARTSRRAHRTVGVSVWRIRFPSLPWGGAWNWPCDLLCQRWGS